MKFYIPYVVTLKEINSDGTQPVSDYKIIQPIALHEMYNKLRISAEIKTKYV